MGPLSDPPFLGIRGKEKGVHTKPLCSKRMLSKLQSGWVGGWKKATGPNKKGLNAKWQWILTLHFSKLTVRHRHKTKPNLDYHSRSRKTTFFPDKKQPRRRQGDDILQRAPVNGHIGGGFAHASCIFSDESLVSGAPKGSKKGWRQNGPYDYIILTSQMTRIVS